MSTVNLLAQMRCNYCCMLRSQVYKRNEVSQPYMQSRSKSTKTHYEVLGLSKDASAADIKKAFFKQSKKTHPDTGGGKHGDFVRVNEAYTVLKNPVTKKEYDLRTFGHGQRGGPMRGPGPGPFGAQPPPGSASYEAYNKARQRYYENMKQQENNRSQGYQGYQGGYQDPGFGANLDATRFWRNVLLISGFILFSKITFLSASMKRRDTWKEMHGVDPGPYRSSHTMLHRDNAMNNPRNAYGTYPRNVDFDAHLKQPKVTSLEEKVKKKKKKRKTNEEEEAEKVDHLSALLSGKTPVESQIR